MKRFYLDTSIWLNFFEDRNEPGVPKGKWAKNLVFWIVENNHRIVVSDIVLQELSGLGYTSFDLENYFLNFKSVMVLIHSVQRQKNRARDIASKRNIPALDVLHALLSAEHNASLVTLDGHLRKLQDIVSVVKPNDVL